MIFRNRHLEVSAGAARLSCLMSFQDALSRVGLADCWNSQSVSEDWFSRVRKTGFHASGSLWVTLSWSIRLKSWVSTALSLSLFRLLKQDHTLGTHPYLDDRYNLRGTRLKSSLHFGTLWLMNRVASVLKWPPGSGLCLLCCSGSIEDAEHFLLHCRGLVEHRLRFRAMLGSVLVQAGVAGQALLDHYDALTNSKPMAALALLAGEPVNVACPADVDAKEHAEQCGKAAWLFDKVSKNFLVQCWKAREAGVGQIRVESGVLCRTPPVPVPPRFSVSTIRPARPLGGDSRQPWLSWVPKPSASPSVRPGRRKNFFVVWCGRSVGVFYRWCDAHASVAGMIMRSSRILICWRALSLRTRLSPLHSIYCFRYSFFIYCLPS